MIKLIKAEEAVERKVNDAYTISNLVTKDTCKNVSLVIGKASNVKETVKNKASDRIYYVLSGNVKIEADEKSVIAKAGDAVLVPTNTKYTLSGTFEAIIVNAPAFDPKQEEVTN